MPVLSLLQVAKNLYSVLLILLKYLYESDD
jgi:hypothetical protein